MNVRRYIDQKTEAVTLAVFRIFFGVMMFLSVIRFWLNGWIEKLYIEPSFSFSYYGFEWVKPLGVFTYGLFIVCGLSALFIAVGYRYRFSILVFFLSFTYIELMDKTTYLNHYYFISLISFLMIFLPAAAYYSWDARHKGSVQLIPKWSVDAVKLILAIVYFYAGLAKLNSDWLIHAMPLKIWLPSRYDLPILGELLHKEWVIYAFSWGGATYDLCITFLLFWKRTRLFAFILVVVFHVLTRLLFPIGMFPHIMIVSALIFFDAGFQHKILQWISRILRIAKAQFDTGLELVIKPIHQKLRIRMIVIFFAAQLLIPWRYLLYPGELFWTEKGFRFSWRVMLMEKAGYANFKIVDSVTQQRFYVDNTEFLTQFQEKQMSFQPDFILQYAHHLADHYRNKGLSEVEVYVESYVALNGRRSQLYIDPEVDLAKQDYSLKPRTWILPFNDEIKGL